MIDVGNRVQTALRRLTRRWGGPIALAALGLVTGAVPAHSAESIIITYGFFERTINIEELEDFAEGRGLSNQLSEYAKNLGLSEEELSTIQTVLTQKADLDQVDVAQFLYTQQGIYLLGFVGDIIQTPTRQSGFHAIRAGLILAAADQTEGLSILNFLKKYPTPAVRIDVASGLQVAEEIASTLGDAERAIALVQALAETNALQTPDNFQSVQRLVNAPPQFAVVKQSLKLPFRSVEGTLFLPGSRSLAQPLPTNIPVIVISHGLGDTRESYVYLGNFLASRGFAVATLDHPGSNSQQIAQLLSGLSPNLINRREFLNRPEDVSALIDEIQRFSVSSLEYRWRLDTQNVGLIGQSFGGYTALALAGATFDPETLAESCDPQPTYLNPSLLLQCQARDFALSAPPLKDDRVKAILVVSPIGSSIFGPSGFGQIEVPVMMMAATADTIAPALPEQIEPFTWLQTEHRYLALASGTTHFSVIDWDDSAEPTLPVPPTLLGDNPELAQDYLQTLSLAFFRRHLGQETPYDAALTARFVKETIARSPLEPLSLIQDLTPEALENALTGTEIVGDRGL
jgi:predicted dienelactone hydrolase